MWRDFRVSPSALGTNTLTALMSFDLRLNGSLTATGKMASSEVRVIVTVHDVTAPDSDDFFRLAETHPAGVILHGGFQTVSVPVLGGLPLFPSKADW